MRLLSTHSAFIRTERQSDECLFFWYREGRGVAAFREDPPSAVINSSEAWIAQCAGQTNRPYCKKRNLAATGTNGVVYEEYDAQAQTPSDLAYIITLNSGYILISYTFAEKVPDAQGVIDLDNFVKGLQVVEE